MKIAVIGAGAIGSVVAGYLSKAGENVLLVGRPGQVRKIQRDGLKIKGARGSETIFLKSAAGLDREYDLVIFTVKTQDIEDAFAENHFHLGGKSLILTTQNGVQADNLLSVHFEREQLMSSIVMFGATYTQLGEVIFNFEGDWILGRPFINNDQAIHQISDELKKAFSVIISEDILGMKYLKLFVNFNNCLPALIGKSMQETFSDLDFCRLSVMLLKEGVEIISKIGINMVSLPQFPLEKILGLSAMPVEQAAGILNKTLTGLSKEPLYGSILQSIMRNKASEIDYINGEVVFLAKNAGMNAPLNRKVVDLVHQVEREKRFFEKETVKKEFMRLGVIASD